MPRFTPDTLLRFSTEILSALGSSADNASTVADHLVSANLAGHDSHGVLRLLQYSSHVKEKKISPTAQPRIIRESNTTALLDGNMAWGQVIARQATELAIDKAREHDVAAVAIRNCYHIGRVGVYTARAARAGFIASAYCNVHGVARVAPWGGTEARHGTNPLSMAVPTRGEPVVVDITTCVVAEGKVRVARLAGKNIPEGWVLDRDGNPTTSPEDLYNEGTILPFGGKEGHKAYGLTMMVDLLGGMVSGAGAGFLNDTLGNGLFIQLVNPMAFEDRDEYLDRIDTFIGYVRSSKTKPGVDAILLPGEPELKTTEKRRQEGIQIDEGTLEKLNELAGSLGVEKPI